MDRPEAKNAIGNDMLRGLRDAFEAIDRDSSAHVVMISSLVPKVFCAGADLKVIRFLFFFFEIFDFISIECVVIGSNDGEISCFEIIKSKLVLRY